MKNDMLTEALYDKDFLQFAIRYNNLITNKIGKHEKYNDELGLVLENLIQYKEKLLAIRYIYMESKHTDMLLDTLKNYQSKDLLLRIVKSKASNAITYRL